MTALGFIETKGLTGAIEAADAMLKAADVELLEKSLAGGGLVTISVAGEVAAVKASIDAAVAAVARIKGAILVSDHVIARPDAELERIILTKVALSSGESPEQNKGPDVLPEELSVEGGESTEAADTGEVGEEAGPVSAAPEAETLSFTASPAKQRTVRHDPSQMKKMNVGRLRQIAAGLKGIAMKPEDIQSARKKELIEAIVNAYGQEKE
ncbi:BMC domain-containing protein [Desulfobotulus alkaliphilus]|uniref:BMC domain-containing protein n=1 Tax=Desulfobotulus alkaliphilus TaxID=622671 RepID=A0A562RVC8_9BACT|nr:BMC domain-containing protein [Desulfobotulus alkaliphilus]TWI73025.1 BMC domain-containing protein [Desulfobotulus alkaliphilus]